MIVNGVPPAVDDPIGVSLKTYRERAQAEIGFLLSFFESGGVAADKAENVGIHTLAFSRGRRPVSASTANCRLTADEA
jgi:hypothetical protein